NQIKIRGYRIEPDEIVAVLNTYPGVAASVVMARTDNGEEKRLVAYVVSNSRLSRTELQQFLLKRLPDYMVPATFVLVDSLPFTTNGKMDYGALPLPQILSDSQSQTGSAIENDLSRLIATLLNIPDVGADD